jgi:photosystem II stability/assembly factor-like uncharacterized protein
MKFIFLVLFILTFYFSPNILFAQANVSDENSSAQRLNFFDIDNEFNSFWANKNPSMMHEHENAKEGGWQQYQRWAHFMKQRTLPKGNIPAPNILWNEWEKQKSRFKKNKTSSFNGNWTYLGPDFIVTSTADGGTGRINCIVFDPNNTNIIWVGTPNGGLWKSTNGGSSWSSNTDLLSNLGISDIAIDPTNTQNMWVITGDKFGYENSKGNFWGGTYSAGILKSSDGGLTWLATSLTYDQTDYVSFQRIIVIPDDPSVLVAVSSDGIWRSTDSGDNWTKVKTGTYYDLEMNVSNSSVLYAASKSTVYQSSDYGNTWASIFSGSTSYGRVSLALTEANSSVIYAWFEDGYLYKSSDGGSSFTSKSNPSSDYTFYGYYDMAIAVSPSNENLVFIGGLDLYKSTNGGSSWSKISDWDEIPTASDYVHADHHYITYLPGSSSTLFSGNDGGIFKSTNTGTSWTDISQDMGITQLYKLGSSAIDPYLIYMGAQDNGTFEYDNGSSESVYGADGMECIADHSDKTISYISYQYGKLLKSTSSGSLYIKITPSNATGDWTTPFVMDPNDHNTIYAGYEQVYKTTDAGSNWSIISNVSVGSWSMNALAVAESNTKYIYFSSYSKIYMTKDGGSNWIDIKSGLPVSYLSISGIAISHSNPEKVWVTISGYGSGEKVYFSEDAGSSWTNISGSLPNIPANCVEFHEGSNDAVYVGTDFGVYFKDASMNDWAYFNTGLPNVIIAELEINDNAEKIRAATYGRGLWESDLMPSSIDSTLNANFTATSTTVYVGETIDFTDLTSGYPASWQWTFNGASTTSSTDQNPSVTYNTVGSYEVSLYVSNNKGNDIKIESAYITVLDTTASISEINYISDLNIFPNPTEGIINISFALKQNMTTDIIIYNALNEVIYKNKLEDIQTADLLIDFSENSKGICFLKLNTEKESAVRKIVLR